MKLIKYILKFITCILINILIGLNVYSIIRLNILPSKYLIPLIIILVFFDLLFMFLNLKKIRKKRKLKRILIWIISLIFIAVLSFTYYYESVTLKFLNKIDNNSSTTYAEGLYYVVALTDSEYESINDLKGKNIGILTNGLVGQDEALEKLKDYSLTSIKYGDNGLLSYALLNKEVDSILIEESFYTLLTETNEDFKNKVNILYEKELVVEIKESTNEANNSSIKTRSVSDFDESLADKYGSYNIYVSGIDTSGSINKISRSDVNIILTVNPTTHKIIITHIPRDYYVQLRGTTGLKDKLTHSGYYGIDMTVGTVEDLLGIKIKYYVKINFTSVVNIVDLLGGLDVNSNYDFTSGAYHFTKGINHLNGDQTLAFVRQRKTFKNGDRDRGRNQQLVLAALINKCMDPSILLKYSELLNEASSFISTNVSSSLITDTVNNQLSTNASWSISTCNLDGEDTKGYSYSNPTDYNFIMIPDEELVDEVSTKIKNICYGK